MLQIKDLSKILLNETIEAYRHHVHQLHNVLPSMLNVVDDGRACPICSGVSFEILYVLFLLVSLTSIFCMYYNIF